MSFAALGLAGRRDGRCHACWRSGAVVRAMALAVPTSSLLRPASELAGRWPHCEPGRQGPRLREIEDRIVGGLARALADPAKAHGCAQNQRRQRPEHLKAGLPGECLGGSLDADAADSEERADCAPATLEFGDRLAHRSGWPADWFNVFRPRNGLRRAGWQSIWCRFLRYPLPELNSPARGSPGGLSSVVRPGHSAGDTSTHFW